MTSCLPESSVQLYDRQSGRSLTISSKNLSDPDLLKDTLDSLNRIVDRHCEAAVFVVNDIPWFQINGYFRWNQSLHMGLH